VSLSPKPALLRRRLIRVELNRVKRKAFTEMATR
jgi:hypothetical protein